MKVVLDTHALIWWVDGSKRLAREQHRAVERAANAGMMFVSEISLWEIAMLTEAGRLTLREPLDTWLERATAGPAVQRMGLTPQVMRELASLATTRDWDPADRIIVATARLLGAALVTSDTRIVESALVQTI